jgi:hypothetical protein
MTKPISAAAYAAIEAATARLLARVDDRATLAIARPASEAGLSRHWYSWVENHRPSICDLFDDVTDLGTPSSPAPSAHRFAAAGLDRAPKSVTKSYQDR